MTTTAKKTCPECRGRGVRAEICTCPLCVYGATDIPHPQKEKPCPLCKGTTKVSSLAHTVWTARGGMPPT